MEGSENWLPRANPSGEWGGGGLRGYPFGTLGKFDSRKRDFYNFFRCN